MKLSKTSAQAALAMAFLADRTGSGPTQARQVADHLVVPTDSALKVLQTLVRQKLLHSQLGRSGGYMLRLPAEEVSLLQIVEAIDGPIRLDVPLEAADDERGVSLQKLQKFCAHSAAQIRQQLARLTVADLAAAPAAAPLAIAG